MFLTYIDFFFVIAGLAVFVAGYVSWLCARERQWRKNAGIALGTSKMACLLTLCAAQDDGGRAPA